MLTIKRQTNFRKRSEDHGMVFGFHCSELAGVDIAGGFVQNVLSTENMQVYF